MSRVLPSFPASVHLPAAAPSFQSLATVVLKVRTLCPLPPPSPCASRHLWVLLGSLCLSSPLCAVELTSQVHKLVSAPLPQIPMPSPLLLSSPQFPYGKPSPLHATCDSQCPLSPLPCSPPLLRTPIEPALFPIPVTWLLTRTALYCPCLLQGELWDAGAADPVDGDELRM